MIHFAVWVVLPSGTTARVGELVCGDMAIGGKYESEFAYAEEWLQHPACFPLDPVSLPLRSGFFRGTKLGTPLGVFEDALPDDWGRRLMIRSHGLPRGQQGEPDLLLRLADQGLLMGALRFTRFGRSDRPVAAPTPDLVPDLATLYAEAERFESGDASDPAGMRALFAAGSTPGGARPKVLVNDPSGDWIAKFPSKVRDGRFQVVELETAGLDLAALAGIVVPEHRRLRLGTTRRYALLVRRFDVLPGGGRQHMISLHTLCKEGPGRNVQNYTDVAQVIRRTVAKPQEDVNRFFQQMVFNGAFGNTDDHLKNFWLVYTKGGYRLSPAFDLVPDVGERSEHCLAFQYAYSEAESFSSVAEQRARRRPIKAQSTAIAPAMASICNAERASSGVMSGHDRKILSLSAPSRTELLAIADLWHVADAASLIDRVADAMVRFPAVAKKNGVSPANIGEIGADILRRVKLLSS